MSEEKDKQFTTGLWKRVSKKGNTYLGGSFQEYWANYFRNSSPEKTENDPDGFLVLYPKQGNDGEEIKVNMYKRVSKSGNEYIAGKRHYRFNIFVNERKTNPKAPDFNLVVYELEDKQTVAEVANPEMPANPVEDPGFIEDPDTEKEIDLDIDTEDIPF